MLVAIEGLIGCGKTSLVNSLAERPHVVPFLEPVESNPFLELYYNDSKRWAYAMQVNLLFERFKMFQEAHYRSLRGNLCVCDRSYYGDYAFAMVQKEGGMFTPEEFASYERMHETLQPQLVYPDLVLFLNIAPKTALKRISKRGRECEKEIPLNYLMSLHQAYAQVMVNLAKRCPVLYIDAECPADEVLRDVVGCINARAEELAHGTHPCYK